MTAAAPVPGPGAAGRAAPPARPLARWTFQVGSRHVPVVGPTEALRGRGRRPGDGGTRLPVAALLDPAQRSSWQLAQEVWQESGVIWERAAPEIADVDPATGWLPDPQPPAFEPQNDEPQYTEPQYTEPLRRPAARPRAVRRRRPAGGPGS